VERANLQAGEWVLVNGATGGMGLAAVQLALQIGAKVRLHSYSFVLVLTTYALALIHLFFVLHSFSSILVFVLTTSALALNLRDCSRMQWYPVHAPQVIATGGSDEKLEEVCENLKKILYMYCKDTWARVLFTLSGHTLACIATPGVAVRPWRHEHY
jgi:hypothetical protein